MNRICLSIHPPSAASLEMFVLSKGAAKLPLQVAVRVVPLRIQKIDYYFLAVQDSSIGDLVTHSVSEAVSQVTFDFCDFRALQSCCRH